ncbi:ABC transporter G family member 1-like [Hevea brasiliensis]|uniref:ABC transporter G family member 1-like n=1 Tax=Hevea brasiliensis TaxID=3981 RepID=UPI0025D03365|nr:ABC transporter G family member 1-like [Hevea brasiliensis]
MASFLHRSQRPNEIDLYNKTKHPFSSSSPLRDNSEITTSLEMETSDFNMVQTHPPKEDDDDDVFLSWKDLWVTVRNGQNGSKPILHGLTAYAQPGELLAIMGPSGCGKSTLLDALAGRLNSNTRQTGEILINGRKQALAYGTSAYVTEDDNLVTTLTVREAIYYSAQLQLPDLMSNSEKKERAERTIREMGLQDAMNTRIGGWGANGLSGGQKRRVSICIEILTHPKLLFLNEPTSGLDSAASYYVMSRIASLDRNDGIRRTIISSIHQPSSEIFKLFNCLCLLSSGKMVYFGPASAANDFFTLNGFPCSIHQNPSDHFLKTINKDFERDLEQGMSDAMPTEEVINTLIRSYKSSETYQQVQNKVTEINKKDFGAILEKKRSHAGFLNQCLVLTRRSFVNMYRDIGYYRLRLFIYVGLAFGLATIYYDLGSSYGSIQARGSLLMFISTFLTFMAIGGFPSFVEEMKVFVRERLNGHYETTAFIVANTLSSMPFLLVISLIPGAIAYYLTGLQKGFEHFLCFASIIFASMILVESVMMAIASIVPNFLMGIIAGAGIQGLMALGGGFFRLPNDLPKPFWKYPLYYIAFHKYAYQGLFKNEFEGLKFQSNQAAGGIAHMINGEEILRDAWQVEMGYSKWVDVVILLGMAIFYRLLFLIIIKTTETIKPVIIAAMEVPPNETIHGEAL